jgi:hypothetical protein
MRALLLVLVACTSTRQLADLSDPRLHRPEHSAGFVVKTTERWHERVDPNTTIRFRDVHGRWTDAFAGRDLFVDREGAWVERVVFPADVADAVRIVGLDEEAAARIADDRPIGASVERDGDAWVLSAPRHTLKRWLPKIGAQGTWTFSSHGGPFQDPVRGATLEYFLHEGRTMRVGWRWNDIRAARVENISGGKTLAAVVGTGAASAAAAALVGPFLLLGGALPMGGAGHGGGGGSSLGNIPGPTGGSHDTTPVDWAPDMAPTTSIDAAPLFTTGARVRSLVRPIAALDASSSLHRDLLGSGVSVRVRFADIFEIGGGARATLARSMTGYTRQTTGMFQVGLHLPLDAGYRYAVPIGFEAGGGGDVAYDLRVPWGLRYSSERWFATLSPATPQYAHLRDQPRRWSLTSGVELGATF